MADYIFDKSIIISGELKPSELQKDINENDNISQECLFISTDPTTLTCHFVSSLNQTELDILENIIINFTPHPITQVVDADLFRLDNKLNQVCKYVKSNLFLQSGVKTEVGGSWQHVVGNIPGFDPMVGEYTCPQDGIYFYNLLITTTSSTTNNNITIEILNELDNVIFGTTNELNTNDVVSRSFIGNGGLMFTGNKLKFRIVVYQQDVNVNLEFKLFRVMV